MMAMTVGQAAAVAAAAERDGIQASLPGLVGGFGKRLPAGVALTGEPERRWAAAAAQLAVLWEFFSGYAAVVLVSPQSSAPQCSCARLGAVPPTASTPGPRSPGRMKGSSR